MDADKLRDMARDPRFIRGIYNYCDRWCERCTMTSRCLVFASEARDDNGPESRDPQNQAFWDRLEGVFEQTIEMIQEAADEQGVDMGDVGDAELDELARRLDAVRAHPLAALGLEYAAKADGWFKRHSDLFESKVEELQSAVLTALPGADVEAEACGLRGAVEAIRWYQHQVGIKIMRALHRDEHEEELDLPSDSDGSAKVALIGIDRSIGAWGALRRSLPDPADSALELLAALNDLRRRTEGAFPNARAFVRPGFDEPG